MNQATGWALLIFSGVLDVMWAFATKKSQGMTHWGWGTFSLLLLAGFVIALSKALSVLPLGMAYAVWTGIGAVGSVIVGAILFGEPLTATRISYIAIIVIAIAGLNIGSAENPAG
ncbi:quaternary ammonium compound-resistance protein SugE [Sphingopyxis sp. OAS728]|uniref:DMT family transporter n=1 Tax=Sphingopyxis sp. OAS728 TaxID=2663823 RepID=UPI00178BFE63|nr:SMR family transporter [Sphingopyxis sp. OAS728]MBE1528939.1 quaternary ammonium compound-resistance protein SugE [Sphingopyxis sp. OAS728]